MLDVVLRTVALGFVATATIVVLRHYSSQNQSQMMQNLHLTRQRIFWTFEDAVHSPNALNRSADKSAELTKCLRSNATAIADCESSEGKPIPMEIFGVDGTKLAGDGANFDWSGTSCTSTNCQLSSSATMEAICPGGAKRCDQAESLRFTFVLTMDSAKVKKLAKQRMATLSKGGTLTAAFTVNTDSINHPQRAIACDSLTSAPKSEQSTTQPVICFLHAGGQNDGK